MRNEKKIAYQDKYISELEQQVKSLESEIKSMEKDIDYYKAIIISKDKTLEALQFKTAKYKESYDAEMQEIFELKSNLESAIRDAKSSREKYEKETKALIDRIRKGK